MRKRIALGVGGTALALVTIGVVNAGASQADGYQRCRPTIGTVTLGYSMYGSTYVTNGRLVDAEVKYGDAVNCRYEGDKYTVSAYGGSSMTRYDGRYSWWQRNTYICETWPGTCTP